MSEVSKPNRIRKRKWKKGSGCKMCKPHKGKWGKKWTTKDTAKLLAKTLEIEEAITRKEFESNR